MLFDMTIEVPIKRNFFQLFIDYVAKIVYNDNVTFLVEFLLREIFNFIRYASYTTYDITVHNEYL